MTRNLIRFAALVNGRPSHAVDVSDRGLLYGDGVFETLAVQAGQPCLWSAHMERLRLGAHRLGIPAPAADSLRREVGRLLAGTETGVLRITLTRGAGGRGYRPPPGLTPTRILALYPSTTDVSAAGSVSSTRLSLCRTRLSENRQLAGIKHLNRLEQVLARSEWQDPDIIDGVMLDGHERVICGTMTNLFLLDERGLSTPDLTHCGVQGTVRALVLKHARALGITLDVRTLQVADLIRAKAVFVTNAVLGVVPVAAFDGTRYDPGAMPEPLRRLIQQVRRAALTVETAE
ncbi:aminodeoxychorismate lyase [Thiohalocapsa marina]|uniref:aminodeoxychorismate lyase n=1 Tax=Thiohalocapsa marina TaxID=424902 RepID=UPI0036D944DE